MNDERHLYKMLELTQKIRNYCNQLSYDNFISNEMLIEACVFNLTQLGETAHKISDECTSLHPELAWNELYGLRNRLVHDYAGTNFNLVWEIITEDLPNLEKQLRSLV